MSIRKYSWIVAVMAAVLAGIVLATGTAVPMIGKVYLPTPIAPQTLEQLTTPGAWTPEMLLHRAT